VFIVSNYTKIILWILSIYSRLELFPIIIIYGEIGRNVMTVFYLTHILMFDSIPGLLKIKIFLFLLFKSEFFSI